MGSNRIQIKSKGGVGSGFQPLSITSGVVDGTNQDFTFQDNKKPTYLIIDNGAYEENDRWTWNGLTFTATTTPAPQSTLTAMIYVTA
jgi:hypothetical protein